MTEAVKTYLLSVAAVSLLLALIQAILPNGAAKRTATMAGGLLVILAVLSPLAKLDYDSLARSIARIQIETEALETGVSVGNRELMADIISERCQAYILDKAEEMGVMLQVEITVSQGTGYPYPTEAILRGTVTETQRSILTAYIADDLGIPAESQTWTAP